MSVSRTADLDGPVHYLFREAVEREDGAVPSMVLLHGLGGSHLNWSSVIDRFGSHRAYALDLIGFGLTPPAGRSADLPSQLSMVEAFVREVVGGPVVMVGNSMGGLLTMMFADARPDLTRGIVLLDPALPIASRRVDTAVVRRIVLPMIPGVGPAVMRRYVERVGAEEQLAETLAIVCADPDRVDPEHRRAAIDLIERRRQMPHAYDVFSEAARSVASVLARRRRFARMVHRIACPALLVHGELDRIVSPDAAERLAATRPDWTFVMLDGVGHVPQIEVPDRLVGVIEAWEGFGLSAPAPQDDAAATG